MTAPPRQMLSALLQRPSEAISLARRAGAVELVDDDNRVVLRVTAPGHHPPLPKVTVRNSHQIGQWLSCQRAAGSAISGMHFETPEQAAQALEDVTERAFAGLRRRIILAQEPKASTDADAAPSALGPTEGGAQ